MREIQHLNDQLEEERRAAAAYKQQMLKKLTLCEAEKERAILSRTEANGLLGMCLHRIVGGYVFSVNKHSLLGHFHLNLKLETTEETYYLDVIFFVILIMHFAFCVTTRHRRDVFLRIFSGHVCKIWLPGEQSISLLN